MKNKLFKAAFIFGAILGSIPGYATPTYYCESPSCEIPIISTPATPEIPGTSIKNSANDTFCYAGIVWTSNHKLSDVPDLSLGCRLLSVNSNDNLHGVDVNARFKFNGGFDFDSMRVMYVGGDRDVQGEIGLGYSKTQSSLLGTGAVQIPYLRAGGDFILNDHSFVAFIEANSIDKPKRVQPTETPATPGTDAVLSCPANYTLTDNLTDIFGGLTAPDSLIIDGHTCVESFT